jgi:hypothetical protein
MEDIDTDPNNEREYADWIHLGQDRDRSRALANMVKKTFAFHKMKGYYLKTEKLLASQGRLYSTVIVAPLGSSLSTSAFPRKILNVFVTFATVSSSWI